MGVNWSHSEASPQQIPMVLTSTWLHFSSLPPSSFHAVYSLCLRMCRSVVETNVGVFGSEKQSVSRLDGDAVMTEPCWWKTLVSSSITVSSISTSDIFDQIHLSADRFALPTLSGCIKEEWFVCMNLLSHMETRSSCFHFLNISAGGQNALMSWQHYWRWAPF